MSFQGSPADAKRLRGDSDASPVQGGKHLPEALAGFAQQVLLRDAGVFEDQLSRAGCVDSKLILHFAHVKPGVFSKSIMKELMPLYPADLSVIAARTQYLATFPFVMNRLVPFITHSLPSGTAVVNIFAGSEPAPASVSP